MHTSSGNWVEEARIGKRHVRRLRSTSWNDDRRQIRSEIRRCRATPPLRPKSTPWISTPRRRDRVMWVARIMRPPPPSPPRSKSPRPSCEEFGNCAETRIDRELQRDLRRPSTTAARPIRINVSMIQGGRGLWRGMAEARCVGVYIGFVYR